MAENATKPQSKTEHVKKTYTFKKRTADLIESHKYVTDGCEVEFVAEAIKSYCADVDGEKNLDLFCDRMYKIISAEADSQSNRMANILFKIAVELAILNYMISAGYVNLDDDEMRYIRNKAINTVRKSHGFLSFEKALEEERTLSEGN
jgi:hypothetical protein